MKNNSLDEMNYSKKKKAPNLIGRPTIPLNYFNFITIIASILLSFSVCIKSGRYPGILDGSMHNLTAMKGDLVEFKCRVENVGKHKVAFFRDGIPPRLIAYDESIFKQPEKYELLAKLGGGDQWVLRIKDVQEEDAGGYICQLNSNPVLAKTGHLELKIPPSISRSSTPAAVEVREGHNVTLSCQARGNPPPTIVWRRADRQIIRYNGADGYGVEPVVVPQSLVVEAPLNSLTTRIACTVEAWPRPNIVWLFKGQPLQDSAKFSTEQSVSERYKSVHVLEIRNIQASEFGIYRCVATNDYGSHFGEVRLIETPPIDGEFLQNSLNEGSGIVPDDEDGEIEEAIGRWQWRDPYSRASTPSSIWLRKQLASDKEIRRSISRSDSNKHNIWPESSAAAPKFIINFCLQFSIIFLPSFIYHLFEMLFFLIGSIQ